VNSQPLFAMSGDTRDDVYIPLVFLYRAEGQHLMRLLQHDPDIEVLMAARLDTAGEIICIYTLLPMRLLQHDPDIEVLVAARLDTAGEIICIYTPLPMSLLHSYDICDA